MAPAGPHGLQDSVTRARWLSLVLPFTRTPAPTEEVYNKIRSDTHRYTEFRTLIVCNVWYLDRVVVHPAPAGSERPGSRASSAGLRCQGGKHCVQLA
jgi:hypothetical protein